MGTDGIKGAAADAFRDSVQEKAPRWFAAAAAFEAAAGAVGRFADTVTWAQGQAKEAIDEYKAAVKLSENAHAAYDTWVKDYESAVKAQQDPLPARPMGFTDPGTDGIESARQKLAEARRQRDDVAHSVAQALEKARDAAPKVSAADAALVELVRKGAEVEHFVGGIAKGTAGLVNFARGLDAHDPYNMNHPTVAQMGLNSMSAGFLTAANDPGAAAKAMLDSAMKDPFEFGGTLVPEAIGPKGVACCPALPAEPPASPTTCHIRRRGRGDRRSRLRRPATSCATIRTTSHVSPTARPVGRTRSMSRRAG